MLSCMVHGLDGHLCTLSTCTVHTNEAYYQTKAYAQIASLIQAFQDKDMVHIFKKWSGSPSYFHLLAVDL